MNPKESDVFGKVPGGANHWSVRRKAALGWEWCTYAFDDGVARQEFPIAELSVATIRERWGKGTYRILFLALGRGIRQVYGNGKVFELTAKRTGGTPKPAGRGVIHVDARAEVDEPELDLDLGLDLGLGHRAAAASAVAIPEDHSDMVRVLLRAAHGKKTATELFETLAIPMGMGLSSLFSAQERWNERLEAIEQRLTALEQSLRGAPAQAEPRSDRLDKLLDRLESLTDQTRPAAPARRPSPGPTSTRRTPPARSR